PMPPLPIHSRISYWLGRFVRVGLSENPNSAVSSGPGAFEGGGGGTGIGLMYGTLRTFPPSDIDPHSCNAHPCGDSTGWVIRCSLPPLLAVSAWSMATYAVNR